MYRSLFFVVLFFYCTFLSSLSFATEKVTHHQVNGYDVYLVDVQSGNSFGYSYVVPYGSADDEPKFFGRAHFFEHMMGRGSLKYPGHETLINKMTSLGYQRNAATGLDLTYYYAFGNEQFALEAMDYGLAPLGGIELEETSFAKEKKTVINEVIDTAPKRPERAIFTLPFAHSLPEGDALKGHHVGTLDTLVPMTTEDLWQLHSKVYRPGIVKVAILANFTSGKWTRKQILTALKTSLPQNFKRQPEPVKAPAAPLFGLKQGPQILEIEGQNSPHGAIYFELPEGANRENVEIFFEAFSTYSRGGVLNYFKQGKNWLTNLQTWVTRAGNQRVAALFFNFTDEGYEHRDQVVQHLLSAIKTYQHETLSEQVLMKVRDRQTRLSQTHERDLGSLIKLYPSWLTTPHEQPQVMMNWAESISHISQQNVLNGAQSLDMNKVLVAFQGSAPLQSQGKDPVYNLNFERRHLAASTLFPVSLPSTPAQVIATDVKLNVQAPSGQLLKNLSWKQTEGWNIVQDNLPHWVDRTVQINLEYGRLTALEELSLQAWITGFSQEYAPEFEELTSQGIDAQIYAGAGSLVLKVRSTQRNQVATLDWLVKKMNRYVYTPDAMMRFIEKMKKTIRNREFGFPANAATSLSSTLFSPRGLSAPMFEAALPQLTLDVVQKAVVSKSLQQARKRLFFGGAFYESEVAETKALAQILAPQNLKNSGPVIGDRFAVQGENLTFFEPWLFPSSEGIGTTRLYQAPAPSRLIEAAALAVVKKILNDNIFLSNRPYGYVQGADTLLSSVLDQHLMLYGQANNEHDLDLLHAGWNQAVGRWQNNEVTDADIENAKTGLIASLQAQPSSSRDGVDMMAHYFVTKNHPFYNRLLLGILPKLTLAEIRATAAKYLAPEMGQLTLIKGSVQKKCENWLTSRNELRKKMKR